FLIARRLGQTTLLNTIYHVRIRHFVLHFPRSHSSTLQVVFNYDASPSGSHVVRFSTRRIVA
ncbi:MAG TPA: hypothetical protein VGO47_00070, partial [Chlamydiales bacterium]|nr:hypothetical protein [Chlamydiales bacterium]